MSKKKKSVIQNVILAYFLNIQQLNLINFLQYYHQINHDWTLIGDDKLIAWPPSVAHEQVRRFSPPQSNDHTWSRLCAAVRPSVPLSLSFGLLAVYTWCCPRSSCLTNDRTWSGTSSWTAQQPSWRWLGNSMTSKPITSSWHAGPPHWATKEAANPLLIASTVPLSWIILPEVQL